LDKDKAPVAPGVMQEPQGPLDETLDDKRTTQEREPPQEEETKRESNVEEEHDDKVDYQCVVWDSTFMLASGKVAAVFAKVPPAWQRVNANAFLKFLEGTLITFF